MKRTTIYLPEELHERLREEAFRERVSMAQLIRSKLEKDGGWNKRRKPKVDPLLEVSGIFADRTLNSRLDEELYDLD